MKGFADITFGKKPPSSQGASAGVILIDPWRNRNIHDPTSYGLLVVKQRAGQIWGLPKGHVEPTETLHEGALRELREETGVDLSRLTEGVDYVPFHLQDRNTNKRSNQIMLKRIHFFVYVLLRKADSLKTANYDRREVACVAWIGLRQLQNTPADHPALKRNRTLSDAVMPSLTRMCFRFCSSPQFPALNSFTHANTTLFQRALQSY
jgi:8-oxo-dGTP pyrophosphatase MutT (NUDIX family)